jgi:ribonuclease HI
VAEGEGLPDAALPSLDVRPAAGSERVAPTNNRGELLGVVHALLALLKGHARGPVEVFSDSEITVRTLLEWLPGRLAKGTERGLKNFDLVWIAWRLLEALRGRAASVALTWVRAHQPRPPPEAGARALALWQGNALADRLAERAQAAAGPPAGGAAPPRWASGLPPGLAWALAAE